MKIAITNDHGGVKLKNKLIKYLVKKGHKVLDMGANGTHPVDYPIYAIDMAKKVRDQEVDMGIAICKTGIGMDIACNKVDGVRCAKPRNVKEARLAREHNNANIIALGAITPTFKNLDMIDKFIKTKFSGSERHIDRIKEIKEYEEKNKKQLKKEKSITINDEEDNNEC